MVSNRLKYHNNGTSEVLIGRELFGLVSDVISDSDQIYLLGGYKEHAQYHVDIDLNQANIVKL
jgi:hypothetical protein